VLLGAYRFDTYRSKPSPRRLAQVTLAGVGDEPANEAAVVRATVAAEAAVWVRDLVNTSPKEKRPPLLADLVAAGVAEDDVVVRVLDEHELEAGGYGGILGVGGGSTMKPRLVELRWRPTVRPGTSRSSARASRSTPAATRSSRPPGRRR
jgi:leucyl aminopeptidase